MSARPENSGDLSDLKPTERFSDRVSDYTKARPGYPTELIAFIAAPTGCALASGATVLELGAGTGLLTVRLLEAGYKVLAFEPNSPMRAELEDLARSWPKQLQVFAGRAEDTGLGQGAAQAMIAAQAFHWFEPKATAREMRRVLQPASPCILTWNKRRSDGQENALTAGYNALVNRYGLGYQGSRMEKLDDPEAMAQFFSAAPRQASLKNSQQLDVEGLLGRLASVSYLPQRGTEAWEKLASEARRLHESVSQEGWAELEYDLRVYWGPVHRATAGQR